MSPKLKKHNMIRLNTHANQYRVLRQKMTHARIRKPLLSLKHPDTRCGCVKEQRKSQNFKYLSVSAAWGNDAAETKKPRSVSMSSVCRSHLESFDFLSPLDIQMPSNRQKGLQTETSVSMGRTAAASGLEKILPWSTGRTDASLSVQMKTLLQWHIGSRTKL